MQRNLPCNVNSKQEDKWSPWPCKERDSPGAVPGNATLCFCGEMLLDFPYASPESFKGAHVWIPEPWNSSLRVLSFASQIEARRPWKKQPFPDNPVWRSFSYLSLKTGCAEVDPLTQVLARTRPRSQVKGEELRHNLCQAHTTAQGQVWSQLCLKLRGLNQVTGILTISFFFFSFCF